MTTRKLLQSMTLLGGGLGFLAGFLLGMIYGSLFILIVVAIDSANKTGPSYDAAKMFGFAYMGAAGGAFFGMSAGVFVGAMNGLFVGIVTRIFFTPLKNKLIYRRWITFLSASFTGVNVWLGLTAFFLRGGAFQETDLLLLGITLPTIIAGIAAAFVSLLLTRWYEKESAK